MTEVQTTGDSICRGVDGLITVSTVCRVTKRLQPAVVFCRCYVGYFGARCHERLPGLDQLSVPALPSAESGLRSLVEPPAAFVRSTVAEASSPSSAGRRHGRGS